MSAALEKETFFVGSVLIRVRTSLLGNPFGTLPSSDSSNIRNLVLAGIGYGAGGAVEHAGSWRGAVVRLNPNGKEAFSGIANYVLLLTPHAYSRAGEYHVVVPLIGNARSISRQPPNPNWYSISAPWAKRLSPSLKSTAFFAVHERIGSVHAKSHLEEIAAPVLIPTADLVAVETRVASYLGIVAPPTQLRK